MKHFRLLLFWTGMAAAQTVFVVRHAERTGEPDPPLNAAGERRAEALARTLAPAKVTVFIATNTLRAQGTAAPAARQAGSKLEIFDQEDVAGIVKRARAATQEGKNVLVVAHRASVPKIAAGLGAGEIAPLGAAEHDRLIVVLGKSAVTLRYGEP
jgi:broad specificity phosphatase PhoE